jgi:hypothetical protein
MGVIAEAMVAFVLAQAWLEKFGGDSLGEVRRNVSGYVAHAAGRLGSGRAGEGVLPSGDPDSQEREVHSMGGRAHDPESAASDPPYHAGGDSAEPRNA